jgi:hypothetical protein
MMRARLQLLPAALAAAAACADLPPLQARVCGNGVVEAGEDCDGGASCGSCRLRCDADGDCPEGRTCEIDAGLCAPPDGCRPSCGSGTICDVRGASCVETLLVAAGEPAWRVGSAHVFRFEGDNPGASIPSFSSAYRNRGIVWFLDVPRPPPYDGVVGEILAADGIESRRVFEARDLGPQSGIAVLITLVPGPDAPRGSSTDFLLGPILPGSLLPLRFADEIVRSGESLIAFPVQLYPGPADLVPPIEVDGWSHVVWSTWLSQLVKGPHEFRSTISDRAGMGWAITVPFVIQ